MLRFTSPRERFAAAEPVSSEPRDYVWREAGPLGLTLRNRGGRLVVVATSGSSKWSIQAARWK